MPHLLDFSRGRAAIAYVGERPWHTFGEALQPGASIEEWLVASGLNYDVLRAPVLYHVNGEAKSFNGREVLYRSDNGNALGVVSEIFKILQPGAVLEFFRDLCADQGFQLETAGALKGGAVYWGLAKTGHEMNVARKGKRADKIGGYLLLSTGADGTRATEARFTSIRVVCNNTLSIATRNLAGSVRTRHVSEFDAEATKEALGLVQFDAGWRQFREQMLQLQDAPVIDNDAREFFVNLLRYRSAGAKKVEPKNPDTVRGLESLMDSYSNAPGAQPGTAYGLVQAVSHFIDHVRGNDDSRLTSAWFGQGNRVKERAFAAAMEIATAA
jgi:phage/plasmid-like protein (TIGR03299 family)